MICPNTGTNALLETSGREIGIANFLAMLFRGSPLVAPNGTRYHVSFTFHDGWVQITLYCHGECAAMAAMACHPDGRKPAATFMVHLSQIAGWDKPWPPLQKSKHPFLLALFDKPFLKQTSPRELQMALNSLAMTGCGLLKYIRRNSMTSAGLKRFPPFLRIHRFPAIRVDGAGRRIKFIIQKYRSARSSRRKTSGHHRKSHNLPSSQPT